MGLDYSFTTVIQENQKSKLYDYIKQHGRLDRKDCSCLFFEMDSFILKYLEGGYDWRPHYDKTEIEKHIEPDGKASIGSIYLKERKLSSDEIEVSFTAATSDMSLLFKDSISISRWFIGLSKEVNSIITYIDLEDEGVRIMFYKGSSVQLDIRGDNHLGYFRDNFLGMIQDFSQRYLHFEK